MQERLFAIIAELTEEDVAAALQSPTKEVTLVIRRIHKQGKRLPEQTIRCSIASVSSGGDEKGTWTFSGTTKLPRISCRLNFAAVVTPNNTSARKDNGLLIIEVPG